MAREIDAQSSMFLKAQRQSATVRAEAQKELATGQRVDRPGDDVTSFQKISEYQFSRSVELAQMQAAQSRLSWYQSSGEYLQIIGEVLTSMSELAVQANSSTTSQTDFEVLDQAFQSYKQQISEIVDGLGGTASVGGSFRDTPLFVGYAPPDEIGAHVSVPDGGLEQVNLFTGWGREGFGGMPLTTEPSSGSPVPVSVTLEATAAGGTASTLVLEEGTSSLDNSFRGMTIEITAGAGLGQSATITAYDGATRTASFEPTMSPAPDASSSYRITHPRPNATLVGVAQVSSVVFAEHVWGADASRTDRVSSTSGQFRPLTEAERSYRELNGIPDSELSAQTDEERLARRKLNIFDPEYGTLRNAESAERMLGQVQAAHGKIVQFMERMDARAMKISQSFESSQARAVEQKRGEQLLGEADFTEAAQRLAEAELSPQKMAGLAGRLSQNLARLNDLVRSGGNNA